ncbi:MAG: VOC family protein [Treponema sp.]|nr:VOC family protein [Treponema sp.]
MENPVDFNGFIQIAIIVKDIEAAAKAWSKFFNVPMPEIKGSKEKTERPGVTYRGKDANYGLRICSIAAKDRGFIIELHECNGGDSTFQEHLDKHGYSVHHLGFNMGEKTDAVIAEMEKEGIKIRQHGPGWTVMDTEEVLGVNLNIKPKGPVFRH